MPNNSIKTAEGGELTDSNTSHQKTDWAGKLLFHLDVTLTFDSSPPEEKWLETKFHLDNNTSLLLRCDFLLCWSFRCDPGWSRYRQLPDRPLNSEVYPTWRTSGPVQYVYVQKSAERCINTTPAGSRVHYGPAPSKTQYIIYSQAHF